MTDTSMMFMMPMPPTTSEMDAIAARKSVRIDVILPRSERTSCCVSIVKSSLFEFVMPWSCSRIDSMRDFTKVMSYVGFASHEDVIEIGDAEHLASARR